MSTTRQTKVILYLIETYVMTVQVKSETHFYQPAFVKANK